MSDTTDNYAFKAPYSYDQQDLDNSRLIAVAELNNPDHSQGEWVRIDDYRDLERQLAEAREARKASARDSADMVQNASKREGAAKRERDEARQQRDRLAVALRMCQRHLARHEHEPSDDSTDDSGWMVLCEVKESLATLKRKEEPRAEPVTPV